MPIYKRPTHNTRRAKPNPDDLAAQARAERAEEMLGEGFYVDTKRQRTILNNFRRYMRVCKKAQRRAGTPIGGRRLSQFTQAGKSAIAERIIAEVAMEAIEAGETPNPNPVIHITIDPGMTIKMLYQEILNRLDDDFVEFPESKIMRTTFASGGAKLAADNRLSSANNIKVFEQREAYWVQKLGVELIIVDEIQRLVTRAKNGSIDRGNVEGTLTADAMAVTMKLQAFLDRGVVPMVFLGDETSEIFFNLNNQFAGRLGNPLHLLPLDMGKPVDQKQFAKFCLEYDRQIVARDVTAIPTCLSEPAVLTAMSIASGGHIGRAARIIQNALPAALERGALTMEAYDLSNAVRDYAMNLDWVDYDPFSVHPDPTPDPSVTLEAGDGE